MHWSTTHTREGGRTSRNTVTLVIVTPAPESLRAWPDAFTTTLPGSPRPLRARASVSQSATIRPSTKEKMKARA